MAISLEYCEYRAARERELAEGAPPWAAQLHLATAEKYAARAMRLRGGCRAQPR